MSKDGVTQNPASIVVFGEALIDDFPDAKVVGGAPFNVARTLAGFGCAPLMITRVGQDAAAELIHAEMQRFDLTEVGLQLDPRYPTGRVTVELGETGHRFLILQQQAYDYIDAVEAGNAVSLAFPRQAPGLIYFGTLAQRHAVSRRTLVDLLKASSALKYLDLNLRDGQFDLPSLRASLTYADILKVNEDELHMLFNSFAPSAVDVQVDLHDSTLGERYRLAVAGLMQQFVLQAVIVTLGERGYAYFDSDGRVLGNRDRATVSELVDTVGCGDAFSAVFLAGMLGKWPVDLALQRACTFASATCGIRGAVSADLAFYRNWNRQWTDEEAAT